MQVTLLPSAFSRAGVTSKQHLTTYLINDVLAIDAGSLGFYGEPAEQARIKHVLISHAHADHIASLPIFVDNAYEPGAGCVTVHGSETVLDCLRRDVFNHRVWFNGLAPAPPETPLLKLSLLESEKPVTLESFRITPIEVHHKVPTLGFVIDDGTSAVVISSDTGPTDRLWQVANETPNLKAVFLEATWPNALTWLAQRSKHMTPAMLAQEVRKLKRSVPIIAVHLKARFYEEIIRELESLGIPQLEIVRPGHRYVF